MELQVDKPVIRISVRNMVEFLLRSGDIKPSGYSGIQGLQQGAKIHRQLQKEMEEGYQSEVRLSFEISYDDFTLLVEGIADGIITALDEVVIDEIKSTFTPAEMVDQEHNPLHWAQAKCYAWMYMARIGVQEITVRLTYYNVDTGKIKRLRQTFSYQELHSFFFDLASQYAEWIRFSLRHVQRRDRSIKDLPFPFAEYRRGQKNLAAAVYRSIRDKKFLFVQASTGTGKTVSTLFPAVKAMGEGMGDRIFYLTAKAVARQVVEQTIQIMRDAGLIFKSITLTAKEKICFCESMICEPAECSYACGHFDRVNHAVMDVLVNEDVITRDVVERYAKKHRVCPFEFELDVSLWVDCIICDYNYLFDPSSYLRRFFDNDGDYVFLVDEAHNLVERARDMYSAELSKKAFMTQKHLLKQLIPRAYREYVKINKLFIQMRKKFEQKYGMITIDFPSELCRHVERFVQAVDDYLVDNRQIRIDEGLLELFFSCRAFTAVANLYDERYVTYVTRENDEVKLKLFCLDPSQLLRNACKKGRTAVFFSGTLQPLPFYRDMLGGEEEDRMICVPSPFSPDNLCVVVAGNISTKYKDRRDSSQLLVRYIRKTVELKTGNYLIFFPSFEYMRNVYELYRTLWPEDLIIVQDPNMSDADRTEFLSNFCENPCRSLIAFAVMGGIFSEGIDLAGERLTGAVVVGVGLPQLSPERDLILEYFNRTKGLGFEYAYMFPGMNRVLQAAGRVIRTQEDRGFVLLLDERFLHRRYLSLFPNEWSHFRRVGSPEEASEVIADFWHQE